MYNFRRKLSRKLQWWYWFLYQQSLFLRKVQKQVYFFTIFLSKNIKILKVVFEIFYWLKTYISMFRFLIFPRFCWFFKFQNFKVINFAKKVKFLLSWQDTKKKSAKTCKNEKKQHLNECFKSLKHFESNVKNLEFFLACFERKMSKKTHVCLWFSQKSVFFSEKSTFPLSSLWIPFLRMYTFMNLNE